MAKKKASGGLEGARVRVKEGVTSPEFPEVSLAGWTGTVVETSGKPPAVKVVIEWDGETMAKMPADYVSRCEAQQLYYQMACLTDADVEPAP
jgi:hypothetical protein